MAVLPLCGTVLHSFCEAVEKLQCTHSGTVSHSFCEAVHPLCGTVWHCVRQQTMHPLCGTVLHSVRQQRNGCAPTLWDTVEKWQCSHSVGHCRGSGEVLMHSLSGEVAHVGQCCTFVRHSCSLVLQVI